MDGLFGNRGASPLTGGLLARKGGAAPGQKYHDGVSDAESSKRRIVLDASRVLDNPPAASPLPEAEPCIEPDVRGDEAISQDVRDWHLLLERERQASLRLTAGKHRVAYTLRLTAEHHARLRFLTAFENRPAQQIMIDALERYLSVAVPFVLNSE